MLRPLNERSGLRKVPHVAIIWDMWKGRRVVESSSKPPAKGAGRGPRLWAFGYADFARLLGTTEDALRTRAKRGTFDPSDLETVFTEWAEKRSKS